MGRLTTHVLDTARGCPASGLVIDLFRLDGGAADKPVLLKPPKPITMADVMRHCSMVRRCKKADISCSFGWRPIFGVPGMIFPKFRFLMMLSSTLVLIIRHSIITSRYYYQPTAIQHTAAVRPESQCEMKSALF